MTGYINIMVNNENYIYALSKIKSMEKVVKADILSVLRKTINCIQSNNISAIVMISDQVIHDASIFQDDYSTSVAVIIYAISQIVDKTDEINPRILKLLTEASAALEHDNEGLFAKNLRKMINVIEHEDSKLKNYFKQVISSAKINKSAKLYDHGISIGRVAEILGRSQWELVSYLGRTTLPDTYGFRENMPKRLNFARKLFVKGAMKK